MPLPLDGGGVGERVKPVGRMPSADKTLTLQPSPRPSTKERRGLLSDNRPGSNAAQRSNHGIAHLDGTDLTHSGR